MIKVVFKDRYGEYENTEYTYKNFGNVAVGDEVVVNTRYGLALAKVTQIDVTDVNFREDRLKEVHMIVYSAEQKKKEEIAAYEKAEKRRQIAREARKGMVLSQLKGFLTNEIYQEIEKMTLDEIEALVKEISM